MRTRFAVLVCWLLAGSWSTTAPADDAAAGFIHIRAADVVYEPDPGIPGLGYSVLYGDPAGAGVYVIRLRVPPGHTFRPHYHDQDRHITVISGVWAFGTGRSGSCDDTIPLAAGAYVMHPKGGIHFDGACGSEPVEVQIIGVGPVETTWIGESD